MVTLDPGDGPGPKGQPISLRNKNIIEESDSESISTFVRSIIPDAVVIRVRENVSNPVLSKLKVNEDDRYTIS